MSRLIQDMNILESRQIALLIWWYRYVIIANLASRKIMTPYFMPFSIDSHKSYNEIIFLKWYKTLRMPLTTLIFNWKYNKFFSHNCVYRWISLDLIIIIYLSDYLRLNLVGIVNRNTPLERELFFIKPLNYLV